ncbi:MAG: hypothetical protein AAFR96_10585 [Planctomycetota bacterium]
MATRDDGFYVGYLPMPKQHRAFARVAVGSVLCGAVGLGALLGWLMDDPGSGVWDTSEVAMLSGTLRLDPVAFVETSEGPVLLVEQGKFGARDLSSFDGRAVVASGAMLSRGGMRMVELAATAAAVAEGPPLSTTASVPTMGETAGAITISGEIIDTKCYLGAMKPGEGVTHAACARLCIRGGIPASIVGTAAGRPVWAVIDAGDAEHIDDRMLRAVGSEVVLTGRLETVHGLPVLRDAALAGSGSMASGSAGG